MSDQQTDIPTGATNAGETELTTAPAAPRRRGVLRFLVFGLGFLLVLGLALPTLLSLTVLTSTLETNLESSLGADTSIRGVSFGWFSGLEIEELKIENPDGFPRERPAIQLAGLTGDMKLTALLGGRIDLVGRADGLSVDVIQRKDGSTNLELIGSKSAIESSKTSSSSNAEFDLGKLRVDIELADSQIRVSNEELGLIEHVREIGAKVHKEYGGSDFRVEVAAELGDADKPGALGFTVDVDATFSRPADIAIRCDAIELGRYRPLLAARLPGQVDEFAGRADGELHVKAHPEREIVLGGELTITEPRLAGALFGGMKIHCPKWVFRPEVTADVSGDEPRVDTSALTVDLGFARASGLDDARTTELCGAKGIGAKFDIDLTKLIDFGGAIPAGILAKGVKVEGDIAIPAPTGKFEFDLDSLLGTLGLSAKLSAGQLGYQGRVLQDLSADASLRGGKLAITTAETSKLEGGILDLKLNGDLTKLHEPITFDLRVNGARLGAKAVPTLQYVIPVLAGLDEGVTNVDFDSAADLQISLAGPALPTDEQNWLQWLDGWSGNGSVGLRDGAFTPAAALAGLLELAGERSKLSFKSISTKFDLAAGAITTDALKLSSKGKTYGFKGSTTLAGALDYSIDLSAFLQDHRDGRRVLEYVDKTKLAGKLRGTLLKPQLALPDFSSIVQSALQSALQKEADKALDPLRKKAENKLQDALQGLFGGKKKKK